MKLTTQHSMRDFTQAVGTAALHSSIDAVSHHSHAAACGSLEHLIYQICHLHPAALMVVNDYIARNTPVTPATAECQETAQAPAACPPSPAAGSQACAAEKPVVMAADEALHSLHKRVLHALFAGDPSGSLEGWYETASDSASCVSKGSQLPQAQASSPQQAVPASHALCGSSTGSAASKSPSVPPKSSSHSSAHHGDACGDINCDGQCDDRPSFIVLIDACGSVEASAWAVANGVPSALRAAARYLKVDMHSLPSAITRRVRERLLKSL